MMNRFTLYELMLTCSFIYTPLQLAAQEGPKNEDDAFVFTASYTGDNVNNLRGGIKTGSCYLGLANLHINFDTKKSGLWKGGQFYLNAANTHGASPSAEFIGDIQVVSNIEAGNHTFFQELWYKQSMGTVDLTAGLQDLNIQFANTTNGALFLNSSFGILPTISGNIPAPIYPLTSLGFSTKWAINEKTTWTAAVYDGCPTDFDQNPYNLNWQLKASDGLLEISEIQYSSNVIDLPGTYKFGVYGHNHWFEKGVDSTHVNNYGLYAIADQMVWQRDKKGIGTFLQLGYGPSKYNQNYFYIGTGLNYQGLLRNNGKDMLGVAFALAGLNNDIGNETTIELTYKTILTSHIFIQPDIQYIINPSGLGARLGNSLEGTLRLGLAF